MLPRLTRLPALIACSLLLLGPPAPAQDKKPAPSQEPQPVGGGGPGRTQPENPDGPFKQNQVTKKAVILSKPEPGYTEEARANCVSGAVRLRAVLSSSGEVTKISVIKPLPDGLTEKAIAAARQIKFQPAQKDGRTVSQYIVLEYNFLVDEEKVERKAVIIEKPDPEYTEEALAKLVEGTVVLDVLLYSDGTVYSPGVVKGLPGGLNEKAAEAARKIKFIPAKDKGCEVSVRRRVEYVFSLKPQGRADPPRAPAPR